MKNNLNIVFILFISLLIFNGCTPRYGVANLGSQTKYLTKPVYRDISEAASYISGQFYQSTGYDSLHNEPLSYFGDLTYFRSYTEMNYNMAYGVFAYGGNYDVRSFQKHNGNKYFLGSGITGDLNVNIPFKYIDWRIIGVRATILYENGEYAKFRKSAESEGLIVNTHPTNLAASLSLTSEFMGKLNNMDFGFYNAVGMVYGRKNMLLLSQNIQITHKRSTFVMQANYATFVNTLNITFSLGLNYKINSIDRKAPERFE